MQHVRVLLMVHTEKVDLSGTASHHPHTVQRFTSRFKKQKKGNKEKRKSTGEHFQLQMSLRSFRRLKHEPFHHISMSTEEQCVGKLLKKKRKGQVTQNPNT